MIQNQTGVLCRRLRYGFQGDVGLEWRLVGIVYTGKTRNFPPAGLGIHAFGIPCFTDLKRGVHEDLHKMPRVYQAAHVVARRAVRAHCGAHRYPPMAHNFRRHKSDASDVNIPVFLTKPQPL